MKITDYRVNISNYLMKIPKNNSLDVNPNAVQSDSLPLKIPNLRTKCCNITSFTPHSTPLYDSYDS